MLLPETETSGPDHSLYPNVVVPSKMTYTFRSSMIDLSGKRFNANSTYMSIVVQFGQVQSSTRRNSNRGEDDG